MQRLNSEYNRTWYIRIFTQLVDINEFFLPLALGRNITCLQRFHQLIVDVNPMALSGDVTVCWR